MSEPYLYTDDYMQASEYLRLVLPFLAEHKLPASPLNYQIAYDFISGGNLALKEALHELIKQPDEPSEKSLLALYKQHVVKDDKALESVRLGLQKIITNIRSGYDDSNEDLDDYVNSLNDFANVLNDSIDPAELAGEVQKVMENTRLKELSQQKFDSKMSDMMGEVETLRRQLEQVREESLTDSLTGIANRKAFDQILDQEIQHSIEQETSFCVVLADIDHFKKFNDTYGHLIGDKVLRFVGPTIKSCVKGKDTAARFGGEEFVIILPDTRIKGAEIVANQIRETISKNVLKDKARNQKYGKVTISLGIAQFKQGEQANDLLKRTDQALYKAKENGRNRVEIAE
ncbi:MAG: GGDEF domain-containing protein [Gammaproteobacteria bacterium]|nr:GGDEF domain-containing protein [Gammaproteobacteria bacterium]